MLHTPEERADPAKEALAVVTLLNVRRADVARVKT
jgi:hypothetical protein